MTVVQNSTCLDNLFFNRYLWCHICLLDLGVKQQLADSRIWSSSTHDLQINLTLMINYTTVLTFLLILRWFDPNNPLLHLFECNVRMYMQYPRTCDICNSMKVPSVTILVGTSTLILVPQPLKPPLAQTHELLLCVRSQPDPTVV